MSTKNILIILGCVFTLVVSLIVYNAFFTFERKFTVLNAHKYGFCFLISNDYTYKILDSGFRYSGKKNNGVVNLASRGLSDDLIHIENNGFKSAYKKMKNYRVFEYLIEPNLVIVDKFEYIEKTPINLVPYKENCKKFIKNFNHTIEIF